MLVITKYDDHYVVPITSSELPRGTAGLEGCSVSHDMRVFRGMSAPEGGSTPEGHTMFPLEVLK